MSGCLICSLIDLGQATMKVLVIFLARFESKAFNRAIHWEGKVNKPVQLEA